MNRRRFLFGAAAIAAGAAAAAAWRWWPEQGFWNPCLARLPRRLADHELVASAWEGIDPEQVWDAHAHLVGTGDSGSGVQVNPRMESLLNPADYARRLFFLNAGCAHEATGSVDRAYVERMHNLLDGMRPGASDGMRPGASDGMRPGASDDMRPGAKLLLFAFDRAYGEDGKDLPERTGLYVPDAYARDVARAHPRYFEWVASIHPYRADCVEALACAKRDGARAVKWLPAAMGIDPASPRCDRFYEALARAGLALVSHAGEERAVIGADAHDLGNPLRLRRALDAGVRVIVAHCASMGEDRDLDRGAEGPYVQSFSLFERMMGERRYEGRLFGDLSAVTQLNRAGPALARLVERTDWHARLLNGSDYPLPGVMPLFSVDYLVSIGMLAPGAAPVLREIRAHNPLLFDFVAKRHLRSGGRAFGVRVFHTRSFFAPELAA